MNYFGINAFSLKTIYLTCIGKQLNNALNDPGRLEKIYQGLTNHTFAKYGGDEQLSTLNKETCENSSIAKTLYLLKHKGLANIKSFQEDYHLGKSPVAEIWLEKTSKYQRLPIELSHKYLNILILSNITTLEQITLQDKKPIMQGLYFQKF